VLVKAARRKNMPCAGTALYSLAADRRATPQQLEELKRLTLALCGPDANPAARIAAVQLAGERGYAEALPILRKVLSSPRRDTVLDIVAIGSVGLLGDSSDIPRLSHFIKHDSRRAPAAEAAIRRINERSGVK
jgi:HEAT repeat protein